MEAEWTLRIVNGEVVLLPASGWSTQSQDADGAGAPSLFRVGREDDPQLDGILASRLRHIVRARNLLRLATAPGAADTGLDFRVELVRYEGGQPVPVPIESGGRTLHAGESVAFAIHNRGTIPIDVTLLLLDDGYGIDSIYPPSESATAGRVDVNQTRMTAPFTVTASRVEFDQLVSIAVRAASPPVNFAVLGQPPLQEISRGAEQAQVSCDAKTLGRVGNPLQGVLNAAICGGATTRGSLTTAQVNEHAMRLIAWRALPR